MSEARLPDPWCEVLEGASSRPVFLTYDKDGVPVFLSGEVWEYHIVSRHAEVKSCRRLIIPAIEDPDIWQIDPEDDRVLLYYKSVPQDDRPFKKALFLRVVVKYVYPEEREGQRTGLISSVYFVDRVKKGTDAV